MEPSADRECPCPCHTGGAIHFMPCNCADLIARALEKERLRLLSLTVDDPLALVALVMTKDAEQDIRDAFAEDPINWWCGPAFRLWGIAFKNLLRSKGFDGEDYVFYVERALKLR
jgi:hypothetical protein